MKTTPNPTAEQIDAVSKALRKDTLLCHMDGSAVRFEELAEVALRAVGLLGGDPTEEHLCGDWPAPCNCDDSETHDAAGVAPQEPSPVASTPTVSDDSGHGGDDDRGGREDGPEDEGRSHQATVAGTPQRPSGCAECHRASGHKMDCSHRFAGQPVLDPEKVAEVLLRLMREKAMMLDNGSEEWIAESDPVECLPPLARAICEAAKRGELS